MHDPIVSANLSEAWAHAFLRVSQTQKRELGPLVVTVDTTFGVNEREDIRALLDGALAEEDEASVDTVASTIFPRSLWNPRQPRALLYRRYERIWSHVKKVIQNRNGTYFRRFTSFGEKGLNQLETVIATWKGAQEVGRGHRRSALQLAVLDPNVDLVHLPRLGFPCLQQVSIVPGSDGLLTLTGYYATQTMFEKAYGNYLGLANLGAFVANELGLPLTNITCVTSMSLLGQSQNMTKKTPREAFCKRLLALVPGAR